MAKRSYVVTRTSTIRIVVDKTKDDTDGTKQALNLTKLFLGHDDDEVETKQQDIAESSKGYGLTGGGKGSALEYKEEFHVEEDEDHVEEPEHDEAPTELGELDDDASDDD
jgi:isopenicillin N synthase-like dioxygenase